MKKRLLSSTRLRQVALLAAIALAVELLAYRSGSDLVVVSPRTMVWTAVDLLESGAIASDLRATASSVALAFGAATAVGVPAGWVLWRFETLHRVLDPYFVAYYAVPTFAFYPVLIAVFGLNRVPVVLIAFAMGVVAVVVNTATGFRNVRSVYARLARSLGLSRRRSFLHVYLPAAAPRVFTGLKLGFTYATLGVLASEFILADSGLGYRISYAYRNFETGRMYALILLVVCLSAGTNAALGYVERRLYARRSR